MYKTFQLYISFPGAVELITEQCKILIILKITVKYYKQYYTSSTCLSLNLFDIKTKKTFGTKASNSMNINKQVKMFCFENELQKSINE